MSKEIDFCVETRNRIMVLLAALAYEKGYPEFMTDARFDELCNEIDLKKSTNRKDLDEWFKDNFNPHTGQWVSCFPELKRLETLYWTLMYHKEDGSNRSKFLKNYNLKIK